MIGPGLFYAERRQVPFWLALTWGLTRMLGRLAWWTARTAARYPIASTALAVTFAVWVRWGWIGVGIGWLLAGWTLTWLLLGWHWFAPASYARRVSMPALGLWRWHAVYRRRWRRAMHGVGLVRIFDGVEHAPQVDRVRSIRDRDVMSVKLLPGQVPADFAGIGEALTHAFGVFRVDVTALRPSWVLITFLRADPLARPVTTSHAGFAVAVAGYDPALFAGLPDSDRQDRVAELLDAVPVGVTETGTLARVRVRGVHLMIAGTTGSGKSGLLWALLWSLARLIRAGYVEVFACDPKRIELAALADGPSPLGVVVKDADVMAAFLEAQVRDLDARCAELEGHTRKHTPTRAMPQRLVVVDELATLTALATRKDRERIEAALGHLESRGRAAGFTVVVTTVEPTKDVVRWRSLHAVKIGFRLEEDSHTDMVLGDGMRDRGAVCDHINPDTPGVAYLKVDGLRDSIRFRTVEITDTDLHTLTHALPHPDHSDRGPGDPRHVRVEATVIDLRPHDTNDHSATDPSTGQESA